MFPRVIMFRLVSGIVRTPVARMLVLSALMLSAVKCSCDSVPVRGSGTASASQITPHALYRMTSGMPSDLRADMTAVVGSLRFSELHYLLAGPSAVTEPRTASKLHALDQRFGTLSGYYQANGGLLPDLTAAAFAAGWEQILRDAPVTTNTELRTRNTITASLNSVAVYAAYLASTTGAKPGALSLAAGSLLPPNCPPDHSASAKQIKTFAGKQALLWVNGAIPPPGQRGMYGTSNGDNKEGLQHMQTTVSASPKSFQASTRFTHVGFCGEMFASKDDDGTGSIRSWRKEYDPSTDSLVNGDTHEVTGIPLADIPHAIDTRALDHLDSYFEEINYKFSAGNDYPPYSSLSGGGSGTDYPDNHYVN